MRDFMEYMVKNLTRTELREAYTLTIANPQITQHELLRMMKRKAETELLENILLGGNYEQEKKQQT